MSQPELLTKVISFLEQHGLEYMVTGSVVSSLQGEPRATHDVDIVVNIKNTAISILTKAFPAPNYYLSEDAIKDAIKRKSMFNLLDATGGDKVDFWLLTDEPFDQARFSRKYFEEMPGIAMYVSRPEDTILMKLKWAKLSGGSVKQMTDARRVYELQYAFLDLGYIQTWIKELKLKEEWNTLKNEAKPLI